MLKTYINMDFPVFWKNSEKKNLEKQGTLMKFLKKFKKNFLKTGKYLY